MQVAEYVNSVQAMLFQNLEGRDLGGPSFSSDVSLAREVGFGP